MDEGEREMLHLLVKTAIEAELFITVNDGEGTPVRKSRCIPCVLDALGSVDEEHLIFYHRSTTGEGRTAYLKVGSVFIIYGNSPWEVIADHTDNQIMNDILAPVWALGNELEGMTP